ncbi:MAG TPA: hypothetical protein VFF30_06375 [Nitrososphaerales archaeon]|nr:hypothetical protein [Nitrososphaerales archaeon]
MGEGDKIQQKKMDEKQGGEIFDVVVTMEISKEGARVDSKKVEFGKLKEDQVKGLADLFSMMAANIEYIKKLSPQFEKLGRSVPNYLQ